MCRASPTHGDPDALGPQPDHIRVEHYVPQTQVFAHADVVVSHGGSGTVLAYIPMARGLPQLCLPQGADQFLNAAAVATSGAGRALAPADAGGETIAAAVADLLATPSYRRASERLQATIASMPSPADVAAALDGLVDST